MISGNSAITQSVRTVSDARDGCVVGRSVEYATETRVLPTVVDSAGVPKCGREDVRRRRREWVRSEW